MPAQSNPTMTEYARSRNLDPSTVHKAARDKRLPLTANKKVDPKVADAIFKQSGKNGEWAKARAIHEGYKMKLSKLEYEKAVGKIIEMETVNASMARCAELMVRDIEQFSSHAEEIMAISQKGDIKKVRKKIKELTDELRRTMASNLRIADAGQG